MKMRAFITRKRVIMITIFMALFWCGPVSAQNGKARAPAWLFPLQIHPAGIFSAGGQGAPYTGAAKLHFARVLGKDRAHENLIFGPTAGVRFINLDRGNDWEGQLGLRFATRLFKTILPIDGIVAVDAGVSTEERIPLGLSLGLGSKQGPGGGLRFAYDFKHNDPMLELYATLAVFGRPKKIIECKPNVPDSGSLTDRVAFEAYVFVLGKTHLAAKMPGEVPRDLPAAVISLPALHDFMDGRGFPAELIAVAVMQKVVADALSRRQAAEAGRESMQGLLIGWREGFRIIKCKEGEK